MNPARARRAADLVIAASREAFPHQDESERVDQAVKALGHLCPLARAMSADRQVHLRIGPGVMTRLFCASAQLTKNPALRRGDAREAHSGIIE